MATQVHNWPEIKLAYMMSRHIEVQAFLKEWFGHGEGKEYKKSGIINDKTTGWRKEKENFLLNVQNEALNDYKKRLRESIEPNIKEAVEMKKASLDL